jgi:hypothetical protein
MILDSPIIRDSPPETLVVFDRRDALAKERLRWELHAWGSSATVENLGYGRVVLIVKPGVAREIVK